MKLFSKTIFIFFRNFCFASAGAGKAFLYFIFCFSVLFSAKSNPLSVRKELVSSERAGEGRALTEHKRPVVSGSQSEERVEALLFSVCDR